MSILAPTDFQQGTYKLSSDTYSKLNIEQFITEWEDHYLRRLFGAELFALYDDNLPRFSVITAPFAEQSATGTVFYPIGQLEGDFETFNPQIWESFGLVDMLKGFIYFEFSKRVGMSVTSAGRHEPETETSSKPNMAAVNALIGDAYNRAIQSYKAIQWYMSKSDHAGDYPEYNGIRLDYLRMGGAW